MAKLSHTDSRRMYSWWWDSHISPKNSKWLQENLTDMDAKVKGMIKLIEEDADSFARRAEMYYKKRPELMKMVEEFYRAYRALAERYDHATGVIRHAHRTMSEAFPNQVPPIFSDDTQASPRTPEMMTPVGESQDGFDSITRPKGMKPLNNPFRPVERARRGLNFGEMEERERETHSHENNQVKEQIFSKSCEETEEIQALKEAINKLEAEKEAGRGQYEQSLDKLTQLQAEISKMNEDYRVLNEHASKADNEVFILKEALTTLEVEKESKLQDYQQCVAKQSNLQTNITTTQEDVHKLKERATSAETEVQCLKGELDKLIVEKDAALDKYMQSLETISILENKLLLTEEDARRLKERAEKAESEVEFLKQTIAKLTEEKEAAALQYQQCLETISILEIKMLSAREEAKRLTVEVDDGATKLKGAEEQCLLLERSNQSLHSELESLMLKLGTQTQELTEKQKELGRLWACIQEERLRFVEAETAFQTLQHLHAQTQEELRSVASELQNSAQLLNTMETQNNSLQDEVLMVKQENKHLNEINSSSTLSIKDLRNEISFLMESKGKLQEEVELRVDQRNALQQEIYCLKEELNDLNKKHLGILDQVHAAGLNPESLESSVKELQDDNSCLIDACKRESTEKAALLVKLEQLLEKNSLLETSLSDLNAELEAVRGKLEALEQSCQSLLKEKSTLLDEKASLMIQLHEREINLEKVSENNTVLESSIADARHQLEALTAKSKFLEDSCQLLASEKAGLVSTNDGLSSQLESTNLRLDDLGKLYGELEGRCITLEKENEFNHCKIEELQTSLGVERQEHVNYVRMSEARLGDAETEMSLLKEECQQQKRELDQVLDNAIVNEIEIFILHTTAKDMKEYINLLSTKNQKLLDEVSLSEKKILHLEQNNLEQQNEIESLSGQTRRLRAGTDKLLKVLNIVHDHRLEDRSEQDEVYYDQLLSKLKDMQNSLHQAETANLLSNVEVSVLIAWLRQLNCDITNLKVDRNKVDHDLRSKTEQALVLQNQVLALHEVNEDLQSKLRQGDCKKEALETQIEGLNRKLLDLQATIQVLQREKSEIFVEKGSLMENVLHLEEKNSSLEEEIHSLCDKVLDLENLSLIFRSFADEKLMLLRDLGNEQDELQSTNAALMGKLILTEGSLEESKIENHDLKEKLLKTEDELKVITAAKDQLAGEIENGKKLVAEMALELQMAEEKIGLVEIEKIVLSESVEDMRIKCNEANSARDEQENQILKLSADNEHLSRDGNVLREACQKLEVELQELKIEHDNRKILEENLHLEMQKKLNEIDELDTQAVSVFGQLQYSRVSQLLYEQKFHELHEECLGCIDQNEDLRTQLAAYGPEIVSLKECISSLENQTDIHIKFQNPEKEVADVTNDAVALTQEKAALQPSMLSDLRCLRVRLQVITKAAAEMKELLVQENITLHGKLDASMQKLKLLQSESGRHRRRTRTTSEITEADNAHLTKDIVLDQVSANSSYRFSKRDPVDADNQSVELWETGDPNGIVGLTVSKSKKVSSPSTSTTKADAHRVNSMKKPKGRVPTSDSLIEEQFSVDKLEISKRFTDHHLEGNKRNVLERLDSDVQKLANLQITVQDLKRKLEVTEKGKRGKAVIECEALKGQLEEADTTIIKLFDLNSRLMKSIDKRSFSGRKSLSFNQEEEDGSSQKNKISEQARRMSEKIGRLQLEVQKLQFVLLKLDDEKEGKSRRAEASRRILLRDYLYGVGSSGNRRKRGHLCSCVQPKTLED